MLYVESKGKWMQVDVERDQNSLKNGELWILELIYFQTLYRGQCDNSILYIKGKK